eukprot:7402242-Pyramimonas_sp.AAC.1
MGRGGEGERPENKGRRGGVLGRVPTCSVPPGPFSVEGSEPRRGPARRAQQPWARREGALQQW